MGAVFAVPLARVESLDELPGTRVALVGGAGVPLRELTPFGPAPRDQMGTLSEAGAPAGEVTPATALTLLIGSEREGLPAHLTAQADHVAHIPIHAHSLNAAMAATVALYEVTRMARA
jgi:TrmH family RNA methyltransferase